MPSSHLGYTVTGMHASSLSFDKTALRDSLRSRRQALSSEERQRLSLLAAGHVLASAVWKDARRVALYVAVKGEIDTSALMLSAWREGKKVLLPLCSREKKGEMRFVPCAGPESLVPGQFGIPEPVSPREEQGETPVPDLIIVPGVAFTQNGSRLGQGGGYYDRLLGTAPYAGSFRLGFAYGFQIVGRLPEEAWDLPVQALATEEGILWITER